MSSPPRFTIRQLEYFVAVAETGTLSSAADRCQVTQAGLSVAVTELERALGLQLLTRRRAKGVTLTDAGVELLDSAREVLATAASMQSHAEFARDEVSGRSGSAVI